MSGYKKNLILLIITLVFVSCSAKMPQDEKKSFDFVAVQTKEFEMEDFYIMYALEMENERYFANAKDVYLKLFEATNKYEYLVNYSIISTQIGDYKDVKNKFLQYFIPNIKEEEILKRLYSYSLLRLDELDSALNEAISLTNKYESAINYELLATIYLEKKEYEKAVLYFDKSLELDYLINVLLSKTSVLFYDLNEQKKGAKELQKYLRRDYDFNIAYQLAMFYKDMQDTKSLKNLLVELYVKYKADDDSLQVSNTRALMVDYLDVEDIIDVLEKNKVDDTFLLNEYYRAEKYDEKAYKLLDKLYKESLNKDFLAQQAILEYELAKDKKAVLNSVIEKFEIALEDLDNDIYQNFLAYLLIDYDIDYKKGLYLVDLALKQDPTNIAYIDTLAWGQYKIKNCIDAYKNMKQIVDEVGLEDEEIALHWEKIKECK